MDISSRKRPWLAAVLALPITGLGHVYLRRWRRAVGWLLVVTVATVLSAPSGVESPFTLVGTSFQEAAPLFVLVGLSAIDAYLLARRQNLIDEIYSAQRCPQCYRRVGMDIGFCEWCGGETATLNPEQGA